MNLATLTCWAYYQIMNLILFSHCFLKYTIDAFSASCVECGLCNIVYYWPCRMMLCVLEKGLVVFENLHRLCKFAFHSWLFGFVMFEIKQRSWC